MESLEYPYLLSGAEFSVNLWLLRELNNQNTLNVTNSNPERNCEYWGVELTMHRPLDNQLTSVDSKSQFIGGPLVFSTGWLVAIAF